MTSDRSLQIPASNAPSARFSEVRELAPQWAILHDGVRYRSTLRECWSSGTSVILITADRRHFALNAQAALVFLQFIALFDAGDTVDLDAPAIDAGQRGFFGAYLQRHSLFVADTDVPAPRVRDGKSVRVELMSARSVMRLADACRFAFARPFVVLALVAAVVWIAMFGASVLFRSSYAASVAMTVVEFGTLLVWVLAMAIFHELGHATACRIYSGFAGPISFSFFFGIPTFSIDVSTASRMPRRQRVVIALAGLYFQAIFIVVTSVLLSRLSVCGVFVDIAVLSLLFNLVPLFRNDGYWALSDGLGRELSMDPRQFSSGWTARAYLIWIHALFALFLVSTARFCAKGVPDALEFLSRMPFEQRCVGYALLSVNVVAACVFGAMAIGDRGRAFLNLGKS